MNSIMKSRENWHYRRVLAIGLAFVICLVTGTFYLVNSYLGARVVFATEPPDPVYYTLTVKTSTDSYCCEVRVDTPAENPPMVWATEVERSYVANTQIEVEQQTCSCSYYQFVKWTSNNSTLNNRTESHPTLFAITEDTTATAVYEIPEPEIKVVNFTNTNLVMEEGTLKATYNWESSSGELQDLDGQVVLEVLSYDPNSKFEPDVLDFLCSGATSSDETVTVEGGWGLGSVRKFTQRANESAPSGSLTDHHTLAHRNPDVCTSECSYTVKQWYVVRAENDTMRYLVAGPYDITRSYKLENGVWTYSIKKHGQTFSKIVP